MGVVMQNLTRKWHRTIQKCWCFLVFRTCHCSSVYFTYFKCIEALISVWEFWAVAFFKANGGLAPESAHSRVGEPSCRSQKKCEDRSSMYMYNLEQLDIMLLLFQISSGLQDNLVIQETDWLSPTLPLEDGKLGRSSFQQPEFALYISLNVLGIWHGQQ